MDALRQVCSYLTSFYQVPQFAPLLSECLLQCSSDSQKDGMILINAGVQSIRSNWISESWVLLNLTKVLIKAEFSFWIKRWQLCKISFSHIEPRCYVNSYNAMVGPIHNVIHSLLMPQKLTKKRILHFWKHQVQIKLYKTNPKIANKLTVGPIHNVITFTNMQAY